MNHFFQFEANAELRVKCGKSTDVICGVKKESSGNTHDAETMIEIMASLLLWRCSLEKCISSYLAAHALKSREPHKQACVEECHISSG